MVRWAVGSLADSDTAVTPFSHRPEMSRPLSPFPDCQLTTTLAPSYITATNVN